MNPDELSLKGSESGHQKALFAFAAMVERYGFDVADDMTAYDLPGIEEAQRKHVVRPVPALAWLHAVPNGGNRDKRTAALMKAEGVRKGIADVFLPVPRYTKAGTVGITYCGLYIEMKKPHNSVQSVEQKAFEKHCNENAYIYRLCKSWREAADVIREYMT